MNEKLAVLLVLFSIASLVLGCSDANDQFIQGTWFYRDPHLESVSGETYLETVWTFDRGAFEFYTCCFAGEIHQTGRYRILESKENILTIELFNVKGSGTGRGGEIRLVIDPEADTLVIQSGGPHTRVVPGSG
jgi:hypothetical protein